MQKITDFIVRWEWLVLLLLIPVSMFSDTGNWLLPLSLLLLLGSQKIVNGRFVPRTPYNISILLLLVLLVISLILMPVMATTTSKSVGILLGIALLFGSVNLIHRRTNGLWWVLTFVIASGTLMALIGLFGGEWVAPFVFLDSLKALLPGAVQVIPGTVGGVVNANELAGVLSWVGPLMIACVIGLWQPLSERSKLLLAVLVATTTLVIFVLLATQSRGGLLALLLGVALIVALNVPRRWRVVLAIVLAVVSLAVFTTLRDSFRSETILGDVLGISGRVEIWSRAVQAIADYPLTGVGVNNFRHMVPVLYPTFGIPGNIDLAHAHNHLLQAGLDLGLPGIVLYLSLWILAAVLIYQGLARLRAIGEVDQPVHALLAGLAGSMLAGWVFGIADAVALGARPGFVWWLLLALSFCALEEVGAIKLQKKEPGSEKKALVTVQPSGAKPESHDGQQVATTGPLAEDKFPVRQSASKPRIRARRPRD